MVKILSIISAFAIFSVVNPCRASASPVWIDTDLSIGSPFREVDDAYALVLALHSPELRIAGISSTYGNGSQAFAQKGALELVGRFGAHAQLSTRNVFAGSSSPRELGQSSDATQALVAALRKRRVTYVALGPLTNLATVLRLYRQLAPRVREVIFVGSTSEPGLLHLGGLKVHDANVLKDPAAAEIVLRSGIPIRLVPIAIAAHLTITSSQMQTLASGGPAGRYLARRCRTWFWFWNTFGDQSGGPVFDALGIIAAARPELVDFDRGTAHLDRSGNLLAQSGRRSNARIQICRRYKNAVNKLVIQRLSQKD